MTPPLYLQKIILFFYLLTQINPVLHAGKFFKTLSNDIEHHLCRNYLSFDDLMALRYTSKGGQALSVQFSPYAYAQDVERGTAYTFHLLDRFFALPHVATHPMGVDFPARLVKNLRPQRLYELERLKGVKLELDGMSVSLPENGVSERKLTFDSLMSLLTHHPEIYILNLQKNLIQPHEATQLARLTSLKVLSLSCSQISDAGACALAQSQNLRYLNLASSGIGNEGAVMLAKNTALKRLDIGSNYFSGNASFHALCINTSLTSLGLSNLGLTPDGAEMFMTKSTLRELDVSCNGLESYGFSRLDRIHSLQRLNISRNKLTDCWLLAQSTSLTDINISANCTRFEQHFQESVARLADMTQLQSLNLRLNHMCEATARRFANHPSLRVIDLSYTGVSPSVVIELAQPGKIHVISDYNDKLYEHYCLLVFGVGVVGAAVVFYLVRLL